MISNLMGVAVTGKDLKGKAVSGKVRAGTFDETSKQFVFLVETDKGELAHMVPSKLYNKED